MQKTTTARIADAFGKVEKKLPGNGAFRALSVGDRLPAATILRTGADAALLVELPDNHVAVIKERISNGYVCGAVTPKKVPGARLRLSQ